MILRNVVYPIFYPFVHFCSHFSENAKAPATPVFLVSNTQKILIFQRVQGIVTTVYCFDVTPKWNSFEITRNQFEGNLTRVRIPPAAPRKNLFCLLRQKRFFVKRGTENAD